MRYLIAFIFCFSTLFAIPPVVGDGWKRVGYYDTVLISAGYPENNGSVVWVKLIYTDYDNAIQLKKIIYKNEGRAYTCVEQVTYFPNKKPVHVNFQNIEWWQNDRHPGSPAWYGWMYLCGYDGE